MNHRAAALLPIVAGLCAALELRYTDESLPTSMNPLFARTTVDRRVADLVFDRLVYRDEVSRRNCGATCSTLTTTAPFAPNP